MFLTISEVQSSAKVDLMVKVPTLLGVWFESDLVDLAVLFNIMNGLAPLVQEDIVTLCLAEGFH